MTSHIHDKCQVMVRYYGLYAKGHLLCRYCGGRMKVIAFLIDYSVVERIINYLKLTFVAERPPPPQVAFQEYLMAAEAPAEYFS